MPELCGPHTKKASIGERGMGGRGGMEGERGWEGEGDGREGGWEREGMGGRNGVNVGEEKKNCGGVQK